MEKLKNINKNELTNRKFKYLSLECSNFDMAFIEKKAVKKFEINKIYEIKNNEEEILLDFCLVLDRKYCENNVLVGENIIGEDGRYLYPREEQRRISDILEINTELIDTICILDENQEPLNKFEIYKPSDRKVKKEDKKSYLQVEFDDNYITVKLNISLEDAIINNKLDHISSND